MGGALLSGAVRHAIAECQAADTRALCDRTTRTGRPLMQLILSARFILSNDWSCDCFLHVRLLPLRSRPPLPVYRNHSPLSSSSS